MALMSRKVRAQAKELAPSLTIAHAIGGRRSAHHWSRARDHWL
jgi:hypothetical protein